jgi:hypothetical protein
MKDDEPTPEELREAEALARALDGAPPGSAPPPGALETAALLRYAQSAGQLDPARAQALAAKVRGELRPRRRRWSLILAPLALGVAGAFALVLMFTPATPRRPAASLSSLPTPAPSLLAAQTEAARGRSQALADLDAQMRAYRRTLFEKIRESGR